MNGATRGALLTPLPLLRIYLQRVTMKSTVAIIVAAIFFLLAASVALAQPASTAVTATKAVTALPPQDEDSRELRRQFSDRLRLYPPEVGKVLKLDPALLSDANYLRNYPEIAAFVTEHPVVAHNPHYFLEDVAGLSESVPPNHAQLMWDKTMEAFTILAVMSLIAFALSWLIRTVIEHRRWSRLARVQAEVHTKLLDRFATSEELLAYIQTSPGRRFLESAPIQVDSAPRHMSAPLQRMLWSIQAGLVLAAGGIGLEIVSRNIDKEIAQPLFALGVVAISVGAGFVLSAVVFYVISRRLNLFDAPPGDATA